MPRKSEPTELTKAIAKLIDEEARTWAEGEIPRQRLIELAEKITDLVRQESGA